MTGGAGFGGGGMTEGAGGCPIEVMGIVGGLGGVGMPDIGGAACMDGFGAGAAGVAMGVAMGAVISVMFLSPGTLKSV